VSVFAVEAPTARELEVPVGRLVVHAKSPHVYEPEWALMVEPARTREPVA
jgi:hypothetical protein